jgi:hypothetical protein
MKKVVKITESDLERIVKRTIKEQSLDLVGYGREEDEQLLHELEYSLRDFHNDFEDRMMNLT